MTKYKDSVLNGMRFEDWVDSADVWRDRWLEEGGSVKPEYYDMRLWGEIFGVMSEVLDECAETLWTHYFNGIVSRKYITDIEGWDVSSIIDIQNMFSGCTIYAPFLDINIK